MRQELAKLARTAVSSRDFKNFEQALATQALPDSFGLLADADLAQMVAAELNERDPVKWILRGLTWDTNLYDPNIRLGGAEQLLHLLWQDLRSKLSRKLDAVARRALLPPKGAVLCFFGRAQLTIIVGFRKPSMHTPALRPVASLVDPTGVLELTNLLHGATPETQNAIKNAALSVDKLVFQRGCIIHVDRQREDVFGPTIDTVLLGELMAEWLEKSDVARQVSVLEVGPGSGLLSTLVAKSENVCSLTSVDLNAAAVSCTLKNLQINDITLDTKHKDIRVRAEKFSPKQFTEQYDLIVCNPPYIPEVPHGPATVDEYNRAVGGLELCIGIIDALPNLLKPRGTLLLMASSLSIDTVIKSIPPEFEGLFALEDGRRVPLDVDSVWQRPDWQKHLLKEGKIEKDSSEGLWHTLQPLWIKRKKENS